MKHLKGIFEKKEEKSDKLEDCPSFKEFNQKIAELKKITKKIHSELKITSLLIPESKNRMPVTAAA